MQMVPHEAGPSRVHPQYPAATQSSMEVLLRGLRDVRRVFRQGKKPLQAWQTPVDLYTG